MGDISIKGSNKSILRGPHGFGPKPYLNKPGQAQGTHGGKAKGGMIRRSKKPSTHGKDVPTIAAEGGRIGKAIGGPAARAIKKGVGKALEPKGVFKKDKSWFENRQKPPQLRKSKKERREEYRKRARKSGSTVVFADEWKHIDPGLQKGLFKKEGGRIGFRKGGTDKKWMQKVSASIKKRGTKGKCTPITKPGCTGRAKALAKTFKKIAAKRKA